MKQKKIGVFLFLQTTSQIVGFMSWVIIASLLPFIREDIELSSSEASLLVAVPVILGSVLRIPFGYLTNRFGARNIFVLGLLVLLVPVYGISISNSFTSLLINGLFVGIGGAVFSIGVTSLPKYFPKNKQGLVNGIYGLGNIGTAVSTFSLPLFAEEIGWRSAVQLNLLWLILFILLNFFLGDKHEKKTSIPFVKQFKEVYKNQTFCFLSIFYFITFGSFIAFTVYLPNFLDRKKKR